MAKSNYRSTYHQQDTSARMDVSSWINQQEKMNLYMKNLENELEDRKEKKKEKAYEASKKRIKDAGYGSLPNFTNTGIESLDYNNRVIASKALEDRYKLNQEILQKEQSGELNPVESSRLRFLVDQIDSLPDKLANAQQAFRTTAETFNDRLSKKEILVTPENMERLKRFNQGNYSIEYDPETFNLIAILHSDNENEEDEIIPFDEFINQQSLGTIIENHNIRDVANQLADTIGTSTSTDYEGLYQITKEGIKFNEEELRDFVNLEAENNPNIMKSFAFQKYGKYSEDDLSEEERNSIIDEFIVYLKASIDETAKRNFDSGLAGYGLSERRFRETQRQNRIRNDQWEKQYQRKEDKDKDSELYKDFVETNTEKEYYLSNPDAPEDSFQGRVDNFKAPTYALNKLKIRVSEIDDIGGESRKDINATALKAYPSADGLQLFVSDGTREYKMNESDLAQLKSRGITREKIIKDYEELNPNPTQSTVSVGNNTYN